MERLLSPRDVATAIGVSESSVKRWADEGVLRISRTAGGHRRIPLSEALRYIRQVGTPIVRPQSLGLPSLPTEAASIVPLDDRDNFLIEAILRGDAAATRTSLLSRYLAGETFSSLCDGPLREALIQVGELWYHDKPDGIYREHRSIDVCIHGIHYLRGFLPTPAPGACLALGGAPANDPYIVPSLMAATVLAAEGWRDINLGANVPVIALIAAMKKFLPQLIWLSFSKPQTTESVMQELEEAMKLAQEIGASFVIGGQCTPSQVKLRPPSFQNLPSMEALAAFARGMTAARPAAENESRSPALE